MWSLKEEQIMLRIRWSIVGKGYGQTKINFCFLCLAEKVHLLEHLNDNRLLIKGMNSVVDVGIKLNCC